MWTIKNLKHIPVLNTGWWYTNEYVLQQKMKHMKHITALKLWRVVNPKEWRARIDKGADAAIHSTEI